MVKENGLQMVPELGRWYHLNAYKLPKTNNHLYCLCIQADYESVTLYVRKHKDTEIIKVSTDSVIESQWIVKNSIQEYCLEKIRQILKGNPTIAELTNNIYFQFCFDLATQFRVYRAKTDLDAYDRACDIVYSSARDKSDSFCKYDHRLLKRLEKEHEEFKKHCI